MVVLQLAGGLGNQLFQYAFALHLAKLNETDLIIDTAFFDDYEWHEYSLGPFNISAKTQRIGIAPKWVKNKYLKEVFTLLNAEKFFFPKLFKLLIDDNLGVFNPSKLSKFSNHNIYIQGYWSSEKYFLGIKETLLKEFSINIPPSPANKALLLQMIETNSVSLHIRRGNYVNVDKVNKIHGTCSMEYYDQAIAYIAKKVKDPHFFVFSDDIQWAKDNLVVPFPTMFVDCNDAAHDYEDLRLMQNCKHNITANSTFSWWGAWLNQNRGKIVIAPKKWFNSTKIATTDMIPQNWVRF